MASNYKTGFDTYNEILFKKIFDGGSLSDEISLLRKTAKDYISRVRIVQEAETMLALDTAIELMPSNDDGANKMGLLVKDISKRYDIVHDDLFIVAAFENFAKAELLSKRYLVHRIRDPKKLSRIQRRHPIHINTIRSKKYRSEVFIEHSTIGVNNLLHDKYLAIIGITDAEKIALENCRQIRNSIHFGGPRVYGYGKGLFNGLLEFRKRFEN